MLKNASTSVLASNRSMMKLYGALVTDKKLRGLFLNRILALPIALQNGIFATFMERIATATERALAAGTLDQGLETLRGDRITAGSPELLRVCPKTGAATRVRFEVAADGKKQRIAVKSGEKIDG